MRKLKEEVKCLTQGHKWGSAEQRTNLDVLFLSLNNLVIAPPIAHFLDYLKDTIL